MKDYKSCLQSTGEFGEVKKVFYPIVDVAGLPGATFKELVVFETGQLGEVFAIEQNSVRILMYSDEAVDVNSKVTRTGAMLKVPVGGDLLGKVINPVGYPLIGRLPNREPSQYSTLYKRVPGIGARAYINQPLRTGVTVVDVIVPLGRGQKEVIIGDKKTGKKDFLLAAAKYQARQGAVVIYAAIAKEDRYVKQIYEFMKKQGFVDKCVVIASNPASSPGLVHITPESAITLAEYFKDQGKDVLLILDNLSAHAEFYRETSLIAGGLPGRESYPGDIFHLHSKIIEKAGNFKTEKGDVSLSCLVVIETTGSDLTGYIPTSLMGMTDGHIFFDGDLYNKGQRPAVNVHSSVTRVGLQTISNLEREIHRKIASFLGYYERIQKFSYFDAELSEQVKKDLRRGLQLYELFNQDMRDAVPKGAQIVLIALIWQGLLSSSVGGARDKLIELYQNDEWRQFFEGAAQVGSFKDLVDYVSQKSGPLLELIGRY